VSKKILFLDPLVNSKNLFFSAEVTATGEVLSSSFVDKNKLQNDFENCEVLCFEVLKLSGFFPKGSLPFVWDVKSLYELWGVQFRNLIDLSSQELEGSPSQEYSRLADEIKAHLNSYAQTKIPIHKFNSHELLPNDLLTSLYTERARLTVLLFEKLKPVQKSFYKSSFYGIVQTLSEMQKTPINIDLSRIKDDTTHYSKSIRKNTRNGKVHLKFKPVGASTGRLSFEKSSLNLYALPKTLRCAVVAPPNFKMLAIDFKSFQPRIAIFSTSNEDFKKQFDKKLDVYSVLPGDREKNKISFLAWMFSKYRMKSQDLDASLTPIWEFRESIYEKAVKEGVVFTKFGRPMPYDGEKEHIVYQHYITANEVDAILHLLPDLVRFLENKQSKVLLPFHDCVIFQIHDEELGIIKDLRNMMQDSLIDKFDTIFPVEVSLGADLGSMSVQDF